MLKKEITAQRRLEQTNSNAGSNANEWRPKTEALCELAAILCPTNCGSSSICNDRDAEEWSQTCDSSGLNSSITEGDFQIKRIKQEVEFLACTDDEFDYEAVEQKRSHNDDFLSGIVAADATVEEQRRQSEAKRPRGVNFTSLEEDMLVELVIGKKEVLENKNSDTDSCKTKAKAWEELAIEFNIRCPSNVVCNRGYIKPFANLYL